MKTLLAAALLLLASPAFAQISPYHPPYPGAVLVQPCGQEPGWVPTSHPMASIGMCPTLPPAPTFASNRQPPKEFQVGHVYRNLPYHLVIVVNRITVTESFDWERLESRFESVAEVMTYQSEDMYRSRTNGHISHYHPLAVRDWFEIAR